MKIDMNLFCLIVALATSITDGRLLSSSSLSSSSSQPGGGSAVEVSPNRRDLEPVIVDSKPQLEPLEYCTAIDRKDGDGKQRGVVDWQNFDQCNKCEGGQLWWPCDSNLCIGFCTPEAVCEERLRLATATATAPDDTTSMLLIESLRKQLRDSKDKQDYYRSQISDVAAEKNIEIERLEVEAEKAADDCTAELEEMVRLQEGLDANTRRLLDVYVSKNTALEQEIEVLKAAAAPDCISELEEAASLLSQQQECLDVNTRMSFDRLSRCVD